MHVLDDLIKFIIYNLWFNFNTLKQASAGVGQMASQSFDNLTTSQVFM